MYFEALKLNLFPLGDQHPGLKGYFLSATGDVYSTKQSPKGRKMHGSGSSYTLNGVSYTKLYLLTMAKSNVNFKAQTASGSTSGIVRALAAPRLQGTPSDRSHARTVTEGLEAKGWVIAKVATYNGEEFLLFGSKPAIHTTSLSVTSEMGRLAKANPGTKFVSLKVDKTIVAGSVVWG